MKIKKNITIDLTENDVKQIIVEYVKSKGYETTIENVNFFIGSKTEGFGMGEYDVDYLKHCSVICEEK